LRIRPRGMKAEVVPAGRTHRSAPTGGIRLCGFHWGVAKGSVGLAGDRNGLYLDDFDRSALKAAGLPKISRFRTISPKTVGADLCCQGRIVYRMFGMMVYRSLG